MLYVLIPPSSPLCFPPLSFCSLAPWVESRQNATCAGWQAFPRPRRLQPPSSYSSSSFFPPPPPPYCSSYWQWQSCPGSEKLICSADEFHRSTRLSANMDVVVNGGGRFKIEREQVWKAGEMRSTTSVFMCVCEHLYKLDASTSCRFLISVVMQMLARLLLLSRCWPSKCIPHPAGFFVDTPKALLDI